ncbi:MAG: beta-galactosidase, partial [Tepidisphaeraceae bacterium]
TIVHVLYYSPERRTKELDIIEDIVPLHDIPLSIRLPHRPTRAYLAPQMQELPLTWIDGRAAVTIPSIAGHAMVVFQ